MIFGGYILRLTFELAHCCAARFSHSRPRFISLDSTTFDCPVPVGSILESEAMVVHTSPSTRYSPYFHAPYPASPPRIPISCQIPYVCIFSPTFEFRGNSSDSDFDTATPETESSRVQVRVKSTVRDVHTGQKTTTGTFAYTFGVEGTRRVLPTKYSEFMEWVAAKR